VTRFKTLAVGVALTALLAACGSTEPAGEKKQADTGARSNSVAAQMESKYTVFFRKNSERLTPASEGVLFDAMQAVRIKKSKGVRIVAYSPSQKNKRRSQQLAMKRLESLKKQMEEAGAKNIEIRDVGMIKAKDAGGVSKARKADIILQ